MTATLSWRALVNLNESSPFLCVLYRPNYIMLGLSLITGPRHPFAKRFLNPEVIKYCLQELLPERAKARNSIVQRVINCHTGHMGCSYRNSLTCYRLYRWAAKPNVPWRVMRTGHRIPPAGSWLLTASRVVEWNDLVRDLLKQDVCKACSSCDNKWIGSNTYSVFMGLSMISIGVPDCKESQQTTAPHQQRHVIA